MTDELLYSREIVFMPPKGRPGRRRVLECPRASCGRQAVVFEEDVIAICTGPEDRPHTVATMGEAPSFGAIG